MQLSRLVRCVASLVMLLGIGISQPALARRTVIDTGPGLMPSGYCSPNECVGFTTPFAVQIGNTSYNTFYANTNGTLSFGSIFSSLSQETPPIYFSGNFVPPPPVTSLATYPVPIFSPNFLDGPGYQNFDGTFDGNFIADTTVGSNSFTVSWYACFDSENCGPSTAAVVLSSSFDEALGVDPASSLQGLIMAYSTIPTSQCPCTPEQIFASGQQNYANILLNVYPRYTMTLTALPGGFSVNYGYTQGALGQIGSYGYSLPTGSYQVTGPLTNQSFYFSSLGSGAVPEPGTWMTMLLGFATVGVALRRRRKLLALAA